MSHPNPFHRDENERVTIRQVLRQLRNNPPGPATDDRWTQLGAYTGVIYIAVQTVARALSSASIDVLAYRPRGRKSISVGSKVVKANPTSNGQARDEDYAPVKFSHPLNKLFRRINAQDTLGTFLTDWVIQRTLTGTAHLWTPRMMGFDKPAELWVLPTPFLTYLPPTPDRPRGGYTLLNMTPTGTGFMAYSGGACQLDANEVLRHQHKHPLYKWDGYSPLTAAGEQLDVLRAIDTARKASMDNEVDPSLIVSLKGATPAECRRVADEMGNRHGGAENRKKVMAAAAEDVNIDFPTRAAKDMDYASGWDQMVKFAFASLKVLPTVVGLNEAGSFAEFYAARRQFYDQTLKPEAQDIGAFLTKHLAHKYYGDKFVVQLNVPPPDNEEMNDRQTQADATAGIITVNEVRQRRGMDPLPDGDLPASIYVAKKQAEAMPQPAMGGGMPGGAPGGDPGMGGGDAGGVPPGSTDAPPPDEQQPAESPEDSLVNAVLAHLDDDGGDEQPVKKGWTRITSKTGKVAAQNTESGNVVHGKQAERVLAQQSRQAGKFDQDPHTFNPAAKEPTDEQKRAGSTVDALLGRDDQSAAPAFDHGKPASRNFQAGYNQASIRFPDETTQLLYDAHSHSRAMAGGRKRASGRDHMAIARDRLKQIGVTDTREQNEIIHTAGQHLRGQMKGVKDGEERKVSLPPDIQKRLGMGGNIPTARERTKQTDMEEGRFPLRTPATQAERAAGKQDPKDVYHDVELGKLPRPSTADAADGKTAEVGDVPDTGTLQPQAGIKPAALHKDAAERAKQFNKQRSWKGKADALMGRWPGAGLDDDALAVLKTDDGSHMKIRSADDLKAYASYNPKGMKDIGSRITDLEDYVRHYREKDAQRKDPNRAAQLARAIPVAKRLSSPKNRRIVATALAKPLASKWKTRPAFERERAKEVFAKPEQWARKAARQHADAVAAKLGIPRWRAVSLMDRMLRELSKHVHAQLAGGKEPSAAKVRGSIRTKDGKKVSVSLGGKGSGVAPPRPKNPAGANSLPARPTKKAILSFGREFLKRLG